MTKPVQRRVFALKSKNKERLSATIQRCNTIFLLELLVTKVRVNPLIFPPLSGQKGRDGLQVSGQVWRHRPMTWLSCSQLLGALSSPIFNSSESLSIELDFNTSCYMTEKMSTWRLIHQCSRIKKKKSLLMLSRFCKLNYLRIRL